jgi:hypothetical protein
MIATNILLNIGFSMVTAFAHVLSIPDEDIPKGTNDLYRYIAGLPTPTSLYLYTTNGASFEIGHGMVEMFSTRHSYFVSQNPSETPRFEGKAIITSNEVVEFASAILQGLIKRGDPLANCTTNLICAGGEIPFYKIQWFRKGQYRDRIADIEIDGRSKRVVYLTLWDYRFADPAYDEKIKSLVYTRDPSEPSFQTNKFPIQGLEIPRPTTNYVIAAIRNAVDFCHRANFETQPEVNLEGVDWSRTCLFMDPFLTSLDTEHLLSSPFCQLHFKDGAYCESINGIVICFYTKDAANGGSLRRTPDDWKRIIGPVNKDWKELTESLRRTLVAQFCIPAGELARMKMIPPTLTLRYMGDEQPWRQVQINWFSGWMRPPEGFEPLWDISAEFELINGRTKSLRFRRPDLIRALAQWQRVFHADCPTVNIAAGAWINGVKQEGSFSVFRDSFVSTPLEIFYSAMVRSDGTTFSITTNSVTIPAGSLSATISLASSNDVLPTNESIVLHLLAPDRVSGAQSASYQIGTLRSTTNPVLFH